jgi:hypothetical protein
MWYFAFVAISIAMFGMTVGAILVYLFQIILPRERAKHHLAFYSLMFAISIVISFLTHLSIPFLTFVTQINCVVLFTCFNTAMLSVPSYSAAYVYVLR